MGSPPDEIALLDRAADGDARAFAALVARHRDRMWAVCVRITGHRHDAEDALQDALVAAWRALPTFRAEAKFSTWVHRIAANAALKVVARRREVPVEEVLDAPIDDVLDGWYPADGGGADHAPHADHADAPGDDAPTGET